MLVWASEFPVGEEQQIDDLIVLAVKWLTGSPHHPWKTDDIDWAVEDGTSIQRLDGQLVQVARAKSEAEDWGGLRHVWIEDEEREWATSIVGRDSPDGMHISVRLECENLVPGLDLPDPNKPYVVKQIFEQLGGGRDGGLRVSDEPIFLEEDEVDRAANYMLGETTNSLPVVYVSAGWDGSPSIDPEELARWLSGLAHVMVEPSRSFSIALASKVSRANAYGGAVGIYWPRAVAPHVRFLTREHDSAHEIQQAVVDEVESALTQIQPSSGCTWSRLQELISQARINELREEGSDELEEFMEEFDKQVEAKDQKIRQLEEENWNLRSRLQSLNAARGSGEQEGVLQPGTEQEYYPGEFTDAVVHALERGRAAMHDDSRRRHIVDDLLDANEKSGYEEELISKLKSALSTMSDFGGDERRALMSLDFTIEDDRRHVRATFKGDDRYAVTIPKTTGDHRTGKNIVSEISNLLFG